MWHADNSRLSRDARKNTSIARIVHEWYFHNNNNAQGKDGATHTHSWTQQLAVRSFRHIPGHGKRDLFGGQSCAYRSKDTLNYLVQVIKQQNNCLVSTTVVYYNTGRGPFVILVIEYKNMGEKPSPSPSQASCGLNPRQRKNID